MTTVAEVGAKDFGATLYELQYWNSETTEPSGLAAMRGKN